MKRGGLKEHVPAIRAALAAGYPSNAIAKTYGCAPRCIRDIRDGIAYGTSTKPRKQRARPSDEDFTPPPRMDATARAFAHWKKNREDMSIPDVAEMYGVDRTSLYALRDREGA